MRMIAPTDAWPCASGPGWTHPEIARRTMNIALWIVAGLLAVASLAGGVTKLIRPKEKLPAGWGWVEDYSAGSIKAIGALEVLAAVGLILPAAFDIAPMLVPLAAVGLVLLMVGALITHIRRREVQGIVMTMVVLALAAFVAFGRFDPQSFTG
ncbi:DoxX family protein [Dactylosporangium sp. CA-233914]|uniref:DoxX family protein n=1 Tax=Dactylosporangium sp. CA-233914 TaxID=3239934 RepID=UPI003D92F931